MKRLTLMLALAPALALAAPQQAAQGRGAAGNQDRTEQVQKRMRLARTLGLAEVLDLDEAGALKLRDVMARYDDRRAPLRKQVRDATRTLRDAAQGDQAAAANVDAALKSLREAHAQLQTLNAELFQQMTQGLPPQKKARAALFLARFREREARMHGHGPGPGGMGGMGGMRGHGGPGGPGGPGPRGAFMEEGGPGEGPMMMERHASAMGDESGEPEMDESFADE
jgi:Heavy-metal resistance